MEFFLTDRQREVFQFLCKLAGRSDIWPTKEQMAKEFGVSDHTFRTHLLLIEKKKAIRSTRKWKSIEINWSHEDARMG